MKKKTLSVALFMAVFQMANAARWDNPNQFEPDEIASEDIVNGMIVCVLNKKGAFKEFPEKRIRMCGCYLDILRD
ncbi:MAG: hypothetical protein AB2541_17890, partial [Candidatus Thiodiazotropha sp.]